MCMYACPSMCCSLPTAAIATTTATATAATGQFVGSPPGQGQVPGGFYWSGGYWGYCPPPAPPAATFPPPPPPGATFALIKSPTQLSEWTTGPSGLASVLLDATGSQAAPGRRIVSPNAVWQCALPHTAMLMSFWRVPHHNPDANVILESATS